MRSIDLCWLSRKEKDITLPNLVYTDLEEYSGCYYSNDAFGDEVFISDKHYDCSNGLIAVNTCYDTYDRNEIENTLAHEWRHHCQALRSIKNKSDIVIDWCNDEEYENNIVKYFKSNSCEMDALLFAEKYAPSDSTEWWISLIKQEKWY